MTVELRYVYFVSESPEDGEYVGLCAAFPSLSYLHSEHEAALVGITALVRDVVDDMLANGEALPDPA